MEESIPDPKVLQSQSAKRAIFIKKAFFGLIIVLVVITILAIGYYLFVPKPNLPAGKSPSSIDEIVAKVGLEKLYKADLDYYLSTYFAGQGYTPKDQALEKMIDDSIILQEGQKARFITISSTVFNTPNKNMASRSALITQVSKKIEQQNIKTISGEIVSIWFNNATAYPAPSIGIEQAQKVVKAKMDTIYQDLKSGKITMLQAGQRISADNSMASIDPSYQGNAYSKFTNLTRDKKLFLDQKVEDLVWNLGKNELSPVTLVHDLNKNNSPFEAYFTIVKVTDSSQGDFPSLNQYIVGLRSKYEIIRY